MRKGLSLYFDAFGQLCCLEHQKDNGYRSSNGIKEEGD
jgi:hypothetical protein